MLSGHEWVEQVVDRVTWVQREFEVRVGVQSMMHIDAFGAPTLTVFAVASRSGLHDVPGYQYYPLSAKAERFYPTWQDVCEAYEEAVNRLEHALVNHEWRQIELPI